MFKPLVAVLGAALMLAACEEPPQMAAAAPPPPPPAQAPTYMVFFDWDRSDLSAQARSTITQAVQAYKSTGSARANAVKDAMVREGVPATAIEVIGRGESQPLVQTADGVREPQNRRVEITGLQAAAPPQVMTVFRDPASYCKALSDKYRQYRLPKVEEPEAAAIAKCEAGNYGEGIPTLEDSLIRAKIPLPAPGYRWPGRPVGPA
jgi:hypothetical protein